MTTQQNNKTITKIGNYRTRSGKRVKVLGLGCGGNFCIHGMFLDSPWLISRHWTAEGAFSRLNEPHECDILPETYQPNETETSTMTNKITQAITLDGEYTTRDGRPVRILCIDRPGDYSIVGMTEDGAVFLWYRDGKYRPNSPHDANNALDLIPAPKKIQLKGWINVYSTPGGGVECGGIYPSQKVAKDVASTSQRLLARVKITIDTVEGAGLAD